MRGYIAFFKKEWLEAVRSYRLVILLIAFAIFGIMSPLTAKLTPFLLENLMPEGISIQISEPTAIDSWMQFFKNIPQMGTIVILLMFSGLFANEIQKQTLVPFLTKGLSRAQVILSKLSISYVLWTISYFLSFFITYAYTIYYWDMSNISHLAEVIIGAWIFGLLLVSILMLAGVIFSSYSGALLGTGAFIAVLLLLQIIPDFHANPIYLFSNGVAVMQNQADIDYTYWQASISIAISIIASVCSIVIFNRKRI